MQHVCKAVCCVPNCLLMAKSHWSGAFGGPTHVCADENTWQSVLLVTGETSSAESTRMADPPDSLRPAQLPSRVQGGPKKLARSPAERATMKPPYGLAPLTSAISPKVESMPAFGAYRCTWVTRKVSSSRACSLSTNSFGLHDLAQCGPVPSSTC